MPLNNHNVNHPDPSQLYKRGDRQFHRIYIACENCRKHKARCELGGSGQGIFAFSGPPCARCRREERECLFSEGRSSRKRRKVGTPANQSTDTASPISSADLASHAIAIQIGRDVPHTKLSSSITAQNLIGLDQSAPESRTLHNHHDVIRPTPVALRNTYSDCAGASVSVADHIGSTHKTPDYLDVPSINENHLNDVIMRKVISKGNDPIDLLFEAAAAANQEDPIYSGQSSAVFMSTRRYNTDLNTRSRTPSTRTNVQNSSANANVLSAWNLSRCVKMEFLAAEEAIFLADEFFQNLAPHTPILIESFDGHKTYHQHLPEEPLLCPTILLISARYHALPGTLSRAQVIHDELWRYVQALIQLISLGHDRVSEHRLRSISSIEALLLLSEWYPRTSQSVASTYDWALDLPELQNPPANINTSIEDIVGPAKLADRMCWMFLGTAQLLGHEMGIFTKQDHRDLENSGSGSEQFRRLRLQELLCIYVTQIAARLGFHSMIESSIGHAALSRLSKPTNTLIVAWLDLMKLSKSIHGILFSSEARMRELLLTQGYVELLEHFQPLLKQWHEKNLKDYQNARPSAPKSKEPLDDILFIEYHTVRMYTNSLSVQGMIQHTLAQDTIKSPRYTPGNLAAISTEQDPGFHFVQQVISDARQILERTVELGKANLLRFHPMRIFHRVLGASIFILKAIILGIRDIKADTGAQPVSLVSLLEQTIQALKVSSVDESHPAACYGLLLERYFTGIRSKGISSATASIPSASTIVENDPQAHSIDPTETWYSEMFDPYVQLDFSQEFGRLEDLDLCFDFGDYRF
ncbi:hypothetical protein LTR84_001629 [Exophiala bonariae]|uniref:Zn(2)-C6 fungal-type domain-containing protein n=1 Tax=Exophiala bonariae TaxID=1690606 RepID=A0AAV9NCY6_9EURO|nr:hypothetical protein LTR84_001629 [Exophiala bonariae]